MYLEAWYPEGLFQSTLPTRGATFPEYLKVAKATCFNPRSPHGERRISHEVCSSGNPFQSTLPTRGATWHEVCIILTFSVSIHAPHTGSDYQPRRRRRITRGFNPRSPHGERRVKFRLPDREDLFQSTLPTRGATATSGEKNFHTPRCCHQLPLFTGYSRQFSIFLSYLLLLRFQFPANLNHMSCALNVRRSGNYRPLQIRGLFCANMLHSSAPVVPKVVKPQAVAVLID